MELPYTPNWDKVSTSGGYFVVHCPEHPRAWRTGYMHVHRIVVEQNLGRFLTSDEVVHHKDKNKKNNDISNLELTSHSAHAKTHAKEPNVLTLECAYCSAVFQRRKGQDVAAKKYQRAFCSRSCNGSFYHSMR